MASSSSLSSLFFLKDGTTLPVEAHEGHHIRDWVPEYTGIRFVIELFEARAMEAPDAVALEWWMGPEACSRKSYTYSELDKAADRLAWVILSRMEPHVEGAGVVALYLRRGYDLVVSLLAAYKARAAVTCLDEAFPLERVRFVAEDTNASLLITSTGLLADESAVGGVPVLYVEELDLTIAKKPAGQMPAGHEDDVGLIIYTSGSTGKPKGVLLEARSVTNYIMLEQLLTRPTPHDRVMHVLTLSFIAGFSEVWRALVAGATLVMVEKSVALLGPDLLPWIDENAITIFKGVPSLFRVMMLDGGTPPRLESLRCVVFSGEAATADLADFFCAPGRLILNTYGPSETTANCTVSQLVKGEMVKIGLPYPTYRVYLLDDKGHAGDYGEICVGGIGLARGYLNREDETAEKFIVHPEYGRLYCTGDYGERLSDGQLRYAGRMDHQVKISGYRVELQEVEENVNKHPAVALTACVLDDGKLVAFIQCNPGREVRGDQMRTFLRDVGLPAFMIPAGIQLVKQLPLLPSGKIDRKALPKRVDMIRKESSKRSLSLAAAAERNQDLLTTVERDVVRAVSKILGLSRDCISIGDNFFALGGSSITAARLISYLRMHGGGIFARLGVMDLFGSATLRDLAALVSPQPANKSLRSCKFSNGSAGSWRRQFSKEPSVGAFIKEHDAEESKAVEDEAFAEPQEHMRTHLVQSLCGSLIMLTDGGLLVLLFFLLDGGRGGKGLVGIGSSKQLSSLSMMTLATVFNYAVGLTVWQVVVQVFWFGVLLLLKWTLIGRYKEGQHPIWGGMHCRQWLIERICNKFNWSLISGTPLACSSMRLLGAKIGSCVHMEVPKSFSHGAWDLLTVEDGVSVNNFSQLATFQYTDQGLEFGPIVLRAGATVEQRAIVCRSTVMERGSCLTSLSCLHTGCCIKEGGVWAGSPATCTGQKEPTYVWPTTADKTAFLVVGVLQILLVLATLLTQSMAVIPILTAISSVLNSHNIVIIVIVGTCVYAVVDIFYPIVVLRLTLHLATGKHYGRFSLAFLHAWFQQFIFEGRSSLLDGAQRTLNNTGFLPMWFRLAGMSVGKWSEISRVYGIPALVKLRSFSFLANYTHIGCPNYNKGRFDYSLSEVEEKAFVGNRAVIPPGVKVPTRSLLGVLSCAAPTMTKTDLIYLGVPGLEIAPNKGKLSGSEDEFLPDYLTMAHRVFWDSFLVLYVIALTAMASGALYYGVTVAVKLGTRGGAHNIFLAVLVAAGSQLASSIGVAIVAGVSGRILLRDCMFPGNTAPSWSGVTFRWHMYSKLWTLIVNPFFNYYFEGTYWQLWLYALATNSHFGHRTFVASCMTLREIDLVKVGRECIIDRNTVLRTHTQEHMELKLGEVWLEDRCTVQAGCTVMHHCHVGKGVNLLPNSLVLKNEELPAESTFVGIPLRYADSRA